jgi:hypothetical protein
MPFTSVVVGARPISRVRSQIRSTESADIVTKVFQSRLLTSNRLADWCNSNVDSPEARFHARTSTPWWKYKSFPSGVTCNCSESSSTFPINITNIYKSIDIDCRIISDTNILVLYANKCVIILCLQICLQNKYVSCGVYYYFYSLNFAATYSIPHFIYTSHCPSRARQIRKCKQVRAVRTCIHAQIK